MKKGFVVGLATGLTIASASLVLANSQIQAILNDKIKVTLNGQVQEFRDETSNEVQYPITYHDRTYLPLRTVANLVGVNVDYEANTNTAILKSDDNILYDSLKGNYNTSNGGKIFYDRQIVYTYKSKKDENDRTYEFPYININSYDVRETNINIQYLAEKILQNIYFECEGADYQYYMNNNILSVILNIHDGYGANDCYVYNFNMKNGEKLNNSQLLSLNSKLESEVLNKIQECYDKAKQDDVYNSFAPGSPASEHWGEWMKAIDYQKSNAKVENSLIYFDNEDKMHIILNLPNVAGADANGVIRDYTVN